MACILSNMHFISPGSAQRNLQQSSRLSSEMRRSSPRAVVNQDLFTSQQGSTRICLQVNKDQQGLVYRSTRINKDQQGSTRINKDNCLQVNKDQQGFVYRSTRINKDQQGSTRICLQTDCIPQTQAIN